MELTTEERNILSLIVIDPDAWVAHALATVGESAVTAKIEKWCPIYEAEKVKSDYKNRAARDAEEEEKRKPTQEQIDAAAVNTLIQAKLRDNAIAELKKEGKLDANGKLKK